MEDPTVLGKQVREEIEKLLLIRDNMVEEVLAKPESLGTFGNFALSMLPYIPNNPSSKREIVEQLVNTILVDALKKRLGDLIR